MKHKGRSSISFDGRSKNMEPAAPLSRNQRAVFHGPEIVPKPEPQPEGTIEREYTVKLDACWNDAKAKKGCPINET